MGCDQSAVHLAQQLEHSMMQSSVVDRLSMFMMQSNIAASGMLCFSRFSQIDNSCAGGLDATPYGVDSVFKLGSVNFNPDLYDPDGALMFN